MSEKKKNKMADLEKGKKLSRVAWVLTFIVYALVLSMGKLKEFMPDDLDFSFLPPFHSTMNALVALCLIAALVFIKKKDVKNHQRSINVAMVLSVFFLLSYVTYHITMDHTSFGGEGAIRYVYFFILNTHIILAGISLPFILQTFVRGYTGQVEKHRKMAKWVFPIWLYVAITGPVIYLMLLPYY